MSATIHAERASARRNPSSAVRSPVPYTATARASASRRVSDAVRPWSAAAGERVAARHAEEEADQRHREGQRDRALGRQLRRGLHRQHDGVGDDDEPARDEERDAGRLARRHRPDGHAGADAPEHAWDHDRLDDEEDERDEQEPRAPREQAEGPRERGKRQRLGGEEAEPARPALPPDDGERHDEAHEREKVGRGRHGTRNTAVTERRASANEPASSSGTRKSRSLAMMVSRPARATVSTASLPVSARRPSSTGTGSTISGTPHGKNRFARSVRNTKSFIAAAHSTSAR